MRKGTGWSLQSAWTATVTKRCVGCGVVLWQGERGARIPPRDACAWACVARWAARAMHPLARLPLPQRPEALGWGAAALRHLALYDAHVEALYAIKDQEGSW